MPKRDERAALDTIIIALPRETMMRAMRFARIWPPPKGCCSFEHNMYHQRSINFERSITAVLNNDWKLVEDRKQRDKRLAALTPELHAALDAADRKIADLLRVLDETPPIARPTRRALRQLLSVNAETRSAFPRKPPRPTGRAPLGVGNPKLSAPEQRIALAYHAARCAGGRLGVTKDGTGRLGDYIDILAPYLLPGMEVPTGRVLSRIKRDIDKRDKRINARRRLIGSTIP